MKQLLELQSALDKIASEPMVNLSILRLLSDHQGQVHIELIPSDKRSLRTNQFIREWHDNVTLLPGLENLTIFEIIGGPPGRDIDIRLL